MKNGHHFISGLILKIADLVIVTLSFVTAINLFGNNVFDYVNYLFLANYLWILAALVGGVYKKQGADVENKIYNGSIKTYVLFVVFFLSFVAFSRDIGLSGRFILFFYNFILIGLVITRLLSAFVENLITRNFNVYKSVAVLGNSKIGVKLASHFANADSKFLFQGVVNNDSSDEHEMAHSIKDYIINASENGIKEVYLPMSMDKLSSMQYLQQEAEKYCVRLKLVPDMENHLQRQYKIDYIGAVPVLSLRNDPLEDADNQMIKRIFDVVFSLFVIIFVLSWLYPILALIIKIQSPGPAIYTQLRSGKDNQPFKCYKFRSMKVQKDDVFRQATKDDDRITKIGKFIRKTSLDELPQFFNVLKGNMSVVGPRPHPLSMTQKYRQSIDQYMVRHFLKSGITGWAQVNGFRGETQDQRMMEKRVEFDIQYLERWSIELDIKIIFMTVFNIVKGEKNAY
ncbi:undecaprenyl-phosphate glucose phosphotransferase [Mucilaginibacter agri]|uniref:Undecaprenyl-phosphate glucose phosphotransferase n=1 Tax=Mucilaginibacter agri TaxID=2695265 RepID=A0A965ZKK0_9SPHI|nr:undecaprenyl-phosphate glucose phosphotransferase [Mucilaginibacter agri]NCD72395.1 undecaprenyl-phosphate glucose phosphotransferase [Mucilaginibacter agri]